MPPAPPPHNLVTMPMGALYPFAGISCHSDFTLSLSLVTGHWSSTGILCHLDLTALESGANDPVASASFMLFDPKASIAADPVISASSSRPGRLSCCLPAVTYIYASYHMIAMHLYGTYHIIVDRWIDRNACCMPVYVSYHIMVEMDGWIDRELD